MVPAEPMLARVIGCSQQSHRPSMRPLVVASLILGLAASYGCTDYNYLVSSGRVVSVELASICIDDGKGPECVDRSTIEVPSGKDLKVDACVRVERFGGSARYHAARVVDC